jgi:hypothetical protein
MEQFVSTEYQKSITEEGNENSSSSDDKKGRQCLSKYWCSGIFNIDVSTLKSLLMKHKHFEKGIIGEEICPKSGNPHLQTFVAFKKRIRPIEAFKDIKTKWIKCNGDESANERYCKKDGIYHKFGEYFNSDWKLRKDDLRPQQLEMLSKIEVKVCPKFNRSVLWFWESKGNYGKTILYTYLCDNFKCLITGGREQDMKFSVQSYIENQGFPEIICINLEKSKDKISYSGLEAILDGIFFSSKYKSAMVRFPRCRVCVFANIPPDRSQMGSDRFCETCLCEADMEERERELMSDEDAPPGILI